MEVLRTSRLLLRTWTLEDITEAISIWGDCEVMKFIDSGEAVSMEGIKQSLQAGIRHQDKYGYQHWAVVEVSNQKIIGACGFNQTETSGEVEIVFHFAKQSWGKGFATEAARACIDYAFSTIKPSKIIAGCHPQNEASKNVLKKLGFSFVGNKWFDDTQREEPCFELKLLP